MAGETISGTQLVHFTEGTFEHDLFNLKTIRMKRWLKEASISTNGYVTLNGLSSEHGFSLINHHWSLTAIYDHAGVDKVTIRWRSIILNKSLEELKLCTLSTFTFYDFKGNHLYESEEIPYLFSNSSNELWVPFPRIKLHEKVVLRMRAYELESAHLRQPQNLSRDLKAFLKSGILSDIKIVVDGENLSAHRALLAARSEVFSRMLASDMKEANEGVISIENFNVTTVKAMLQFIYTGSIENLTVEFAEDLLLISNQFLLEALKRKCSDFLNSNIAEGNVLRILKLADLCSDPDLKSTAVHFITNNFKKIVITADWQTFHEGNVELVQHIIIALFNKL